MTPVDQQFTSKPEIGQFGDCQRAVIASLLNLPIAAVPHFLQEANGDSDGYWTGIQTFLRKFGFAYLTTNTAWAFWGDDDHLIYHEISGPSPRGNGLYHAVVGLNGQIAHDPHPSRDGLAGDPNKWEHAYLVHVGGVTQSIGGALAAARGLLAEILAADEASIAELKVMGLEVPDTDTSPAWATTQRIRELLGVARPAAGLPAMQEQAPWPSPVTIMTESVPCAAHAERLPKDAA